VTFEDASEVEADAVIWATGYRPDYSWIDLPIRDSNGRLRHRRGVTDVPGHYFLGLTWQHTRGSALIGWVKDDAEFLAGRIETLQEAIRVAQEPAHEEAGVRAGAPAREG
jgi:putative flavoprotein involved in K+ transport